MKAYKFTNLFLTALIICFSCDSGDEVMPVPSLADLEESDNIIHLSKVSNNDLIKSAIKFEAVHQVPVPTGGEMPILMPMVIPTNGNRFILRAPIMTILGSVVPSEAAAFLAGGELYAELEAFWKVPFSDPALIMQGTGPAKGEFSILRNGDLIWKGIITGIRNNVGTDDHPVFQWRGHIKADGIGEYEGLKLTATEYTDPSPLPAMTYYWTGVITP